MTHSHLQTTFKFGNFILGSGNIFKCIAAYFIIFVIFFSYYAIAGYREEVPSYMIFFQFFYFIFYTAALIGAYKVNTTRKEFYVFVFIYSLISALLLREISWVYLDEPFLGGIDSKTYNGFGTEAIKQDFTYLRYIDFISEDWGIDDRGMPSIIYFTYKIAGSVIIGQYLLLFVNAFIISGCAWRLDGILRYFKIEKKIRRFCVAVYAFFPFLTLISAIGLKENFFLFIIISAFYYMFRYKETKAPVYFFYAIVLSGCTIFFRIATFGMMIISFFICLISNEKNGKGVMRLMVFGAIIGIFAIGAILTVLIGRNLEAFLAIAASRTGQVSEGVGSIGQWVVGSLAVFLGPFPNFAKLSEYALVHSSGVLMKGILGFPILMGMILYTRKYISKFYPLLVYFLMNMLMVVLVGVSLDMRYQIPFFPMALPYAASYMQEKNFKDKFLIYIFFLFVLVWFYNKR